MLFRLFEVCVALAVIAGFGLAFPRSTVGRFVAVVLAGLGLRLRRFEAANAMGLYDRAIARSRDEIKAGLDGISAVQAARLATERRHGDAISQVERLERALDRLDKQGVPDRDPRKLELARHLLRERNSVDALAKQFARQQAAEEHAVSQLQGANRELARAAAEQQDLAADLKAAEAEGAAAKVTVAFQHGLGGLSSELAEARERLVDRIDAERARAGMLADVAGPGLDVAADEENYGAEFLLAQRRKSKDDPSQPETSDAS